MDKAIAKQKLKSFGAAIAAAAKRNYLMLGYIVTAILLELTGVAITSGHFYMTEPWLYFTLLAFPCLASLYFKKHKTRYAVFLSMLLLHFVFDTLFIMLYDSNGTIFDFAMIDLRMDAMMIVESVPISFVNFFVSGILISLYGTLGFMLIKRMPEPRAPGKIRMSVTAVLLALVIGADALLLYFANYQNNADDLSYRLYRTENGTYSNKGMIGNFVNELARGLWFSDINMGDEDEMREFVYREQTEPTEMFGYADGYNVVTILGESFEWFTFIADAERYPNGYAKHLKSNGGTMTDKELSDALHALYPNFYRLYDGSSTVVLDNQYSLEKTDISENKAIIGNYPLYKFINYSYPYNTVPYSVPNTMKALYGVDSGYFHDGYRTFYNRNIHQTHALGYKYFKSVEDMGFKDDSTGLGERNLDSQMIEYCKDEMFPADRRFNTFITTITQHGQYAYRDNLVPYYDRLDEYGLLPYREGDDDWNALRYYCAAGMDLDKAIGIMLDDLDKKGIADKTLILMYGDHNCYYQGISNYVKNIYSYHSETYTKLYNTPAMIRIGTAPLNGAGNKPESGSGALFIDKFTCMSDLVPTIYDLLGIRCYKNLLYGTSAFSNDESVLYSRAYDRFITDKVYFNSINYMTYRAQDVDSAYLDIVEQKCVTLLDKISHVNRMFAGDFFKGDNEIEYFNRLRELNGLPQQV